MNSEFYIEQVTKLGYKIIDTSTNECLWDLETGSNLFTYEECEEMLKMEVAR